MKMTEELRKNLIRSGILLLAFVIYTICVAHVDVKELALLHTDTGISGPETASIGFAALNGAVSSALGFQKGFYTISKLCGILSYLTAAFFAFLFLAQIISRKSIQKADPDLYVLMFFYVAVVITYVLFEILKINYRPVIRGKGLEASYPSTHTLLGICIFLTAATQLQKRIADKRLNKLLVIACYVLAALTVLCRFLSGVHWTTDIVGGILVSVFLISLYALGLQVANGLRKGASN